MTIANLTSNSFEDDTGGHYKFPYFSLYCFVIFNPAQKNHHKSNDN